MARLCSTWSLHPDAGQPGLASKRQRELAPLPLLSKANPKSSPEVRTAAGISQEERRVEKWIQALYVAFEAARVGVAVLYLLAFPLS
ncbi:unnamed protein product [Rangifer tarandus platyrhynchus]|uniref:Uncharacterized protein n=1 Tax=Rangifer tarandus platyrhynchus TaxID=3082113 RepID=A0AC60A1Q7_RANTA